MELTQGVRFDSLGLSEPILRAIEKKGYEVSTPIQAGAIPPMLEWRDVTAKAPGKRGGPGCDPGADPGTGAADH